MWKIELGVGGDENQRVGWIWLAIYIPKSKRGQKKLRKDAYKNGHAVPHFFYLFFHTL